MIIDRLGETRRVWAGLCGSSDHNSLTIFSRNDDLINMAFTMLMAVGRIIRHVEFKG